MKYSNYKDSGVEWIGEIPEHWLFSRLGFYVETIVPMRDKPDNLSGDIPWIRIEDVDNKYISSSKSNQGVSVETVKKMNLKVYPINTVLCTCSCSFGTTVIVKKPLTSNQTFIGLVPQEHRIYNEFLYYLLQVWKEELEQQSSGSIQLYLSRDNFKSLKVVIPSIIEQQQIVSYLDQRTTIINELIQKKLQKIELLKEKRNSIINQTVTKGLIQDARMKDSGIGWIREIPEHWHKTKLKLKFKLTGGGTPSKENSDYWNGDIPWISPKDMKTKYIDNSEDKITQTGLENSATNLIKESTLLIVVRSGILQRTIPIGINTVPVTINQDLKSLQAFFGDSVDFLYYFIKGNEENLLKEWSKVGATVESLEMEFMHNTKIPFPPLPEQYQIVEYLDKKTSEINKQVDLEYRKLELLKEYRHSLIFEVMTGKINVQSN